MFCIGSMSRLYASSRQSLGQYVLATPEKREYIHEIGGRKNPVCFENIFDFLKKNPKFDLDFPYIWKKCLDNDFAFALLSKQGWLKSFLTHSLASLILTSSIETNKLFSFSLKEKKERRVKLC